MNPQKFIEAIGDIDDKFILKYAQCDTKRHPKKSFLFSPMAACISLCIVVAIIFVISKNKLPIEQNPDDFYDVNTSIQYVLYDTYKYKVVTNPDELSQYDLPLEITATIKGGKIGDGYLESDSQVVGIYAVNNVEDSSILIAQINAEYYYITLMTK